MSDIFRHLEAVVSTYLKHLHMNIIYAVKQKGARMERKIIAKMLV